jgi:hypothetical protein
MTTQEAFKRRIRARMAKTGERYVAARRALLTEPDGWVSRPDTADDAIREATGRGWDEWRAVIDAWPGHDRGHTAVARWLVDEHGVPGWWAQNVTVGWERITGRRLPNQRTDGTFNANRTRTVTVDRDALRALLLDDEGRDDLFPGLEVTLRSKPTAKALRFGVGPGVAIIALDPLADGRTTISVAHEKLPAAEDVEVWKAYWGDWLEAVDDA